MEAEGEENIENENEEQHIEVENEVGERQEKEAEEEEEEENVAEEEEEEEEVKAVKKRRCQRRKKKRLCLDGEGELEDEEELALEEEEEDEEDEEEEEEESDIVSYGLSVLSAITFEWENDVYEFEELCDPGNIDTIYRRHYQYVEEADELGITRYLQLCRALGIPPMVRVLKSLKTDEIDLSFRNVDNKSIRAMCAALEINNVVSRFIMKFNKLTFDDCYYIGLMLKKNETISVLDFTGCRLGAEALGLVIEHLTYNEVLTELNLSKCNIQDEGMKLLSPVLKRNNSIEKLDLSYNKLGDESGEPLAVAFRMNTSITNLNLKYNYLFNPNTLRGFFRVLAGSNNTITHLDLSWNGLNGPDTANLIANFLRRNRSIRYLDLSDNRFEGLAALELKRGLSRSTNLEILKIGKNPFSSEDLDALLSGCKGSASLNVLDLEDCWVKKSFLKILKKIRKTKEIEVKIGGIYGNYEVFGPDYPKVILQRAQFEAMKPKQEKKRKDFGHLIWTMGDEPLSEEDFMLMVKKFKAKISKELFPELIKQYFNPRTQLIDVVAMRKKYLSIFPDSTPPPPKPPKLKKGQKVPEEPAEPPKEGQQPPPAEPSAPSAPSEGEAGELEIEGFGEEDEFGELMIDGFEGGEGGGGDEGAEGGEGVEEVPVAES